MIRKDFRYSDNRFSTLGKRATMSIISEASKNVDLSRYSRKGMSMTAQRSQRALVGDYQVMIHKRYNLDDDFKESSKITWSS